MRYKFFLLKTVISIGENWLNKKTTPSINIPFSSKSEYLLLSFHFQIKMKKITFWIVSSYFYKFGFCVAQKFQSSLKHKLA